jgi:hypothetical protein
VSPRTANGWRAFWRDRGERELERLLAEAWEPARPGDATRIATLLGSRAGVDALAQELARMRAEHGAPRDDAADRRAAERVAVWFDAAAAA